MPDPLGPFAYTWPFYAAALIGYLVGSIPFGLVLTRLAGTADLRTIGSGNIGATNVLRTGRKDLAAATLVLDALKGAAVVLAASTWLTPDFAVLAGVGAFLGHLFPLWLGFAERRTALRTLATVVLLAAAFATLGWKGHWIVYAVALLVVLAAAYALAWGGKGVATGLGVLLALALPVGLVACAVWLAVAALFRYSSLAALLAFAAAPFAAHYLADTQVAETAMLLFLLTFVRHHDNVRRLLRGEESRIGRRAA